MQPASLSEHSPARMTPEHVRHRYFGRKPSRNLLRPDTGHTSTLHTTPPPKKKQDRHRTSCLWTPRAPQLPQKKWHSGVLQNRVGTSPCPPPTPYIYLYLYPPPKKRKKNKSDADNCVSVHRVHHKYRKKFGIVEFFRTRPEPTLCEATTPLRYTLPPPHQKKGKNKIDTEHHVFGIRVHHNCRKKKMA